MRLAHNAYRSYEELTRDLQELVSQAPHLATIESIGQSHQGREIWALTLHQPGDRRTRAEASLLHRRQQPRRGGHYLRRGAVHYRFSACQLRAGCRVTELLDTRCLYLLPRVNPDGAEISLTTPYRTVGNGHYPPWEEQTTGLHIEDVNGDGRILEMRIPDPKGEWKRSEEEPRLLTLREPGEIRRRLLSPAAGGAPAGMGWGHPSDPQAAPWQPQPTVSHQLAARVWRVWSGRPAAERAGGRGDRALRAWRTPTSRVPRPTTATVT